jgi:DNA-binding transcriptional regulator YhcF (GntR family)
MLMELDGKTTLGAFANKMAINMGTMRDVISNLLKLGLVESVAREIVAVDRSAVSGGA